MIQESFKAPVAIVQEYREKLEYRLVGTERPKRGHLIFEFDFDTGILRVITPKAEDISKTVVSNKFRQVSVPGTPIEETTKRIKIQRKPGCLYFSRLNYRSAFRYLTKIMPGITFTEIPQNG